MSLDPKERDFLGRIVRDAWVRWARTQPDPKPSWLVPYGELTEPEKEADRQIGEAVALQLRVDSLMAMNDRLLATVERQSAEISRLHSQLARFMEAAS